MIFLRQMRVFLFFSSSYFPLSMKNVITYLMSSFYRVKKQLRREVADFEFVLWILTIHSSIFIKKALLLKNF